MPTRRISRWDIADHVEREQQQRHEKRIASGDWVLTESTDGLGGLVWRKVEHDA